MAREVTLLTLRGDVRWQADMVGATGRNTDADIDRAINQSRQRFRERVSHHGIRYYLVSTTGTLPAGASNPYPFGLLSMLAWDPGAVRIFGLDITVNGRVLPLEEVAFDNRADFQRAELGASVGAPPLAYAPFGTDSIAILPASDGAYPYVAWYLPVVPDLVVDSDVFDGVAGWEEWVKWDAVVKLINRDQYANAYQMAVTERETVWADIERSAPRKAAGRLQRQDARGLKMNRLHHHRRWIER